jgi:MORN repeat variant
MSPMPVPAAALQLERPEGANYTEYYHVAADGTTPHGPAIVKTNAAGLRAAEREYHDGRLVWMKLYDADTQALLRTMYYDDEMNPHGTWHQYDVNGTMVEEVTYNHGIKDGTETMYFPDGTLRFRATYKNGHMHGERIILISRAASPGGEHIYDSMTFDQGLRVSSVNPMTHPRLFIPPGSRGDETD